MESFAGNHFLRSLTPSDQAALESYLRPATLSLGQVIIEQGDPVERAVFPIDAQLANVVHLSDSSSVEVAFVGLEGLAGLAPIMSDRPCGWEVKVRSAGRAFVGPAGPVRTLQRTSPTFLARLLDLTQFYQEQAAQLSACNATHRTLPRLARWLLTARDISPSDRLDFTQDELADLLGSQRTTINQAAQDLKALGALRYGRGHITILDRPALEAATCSCYRALRERAAELHV